MTGVQTKEPKRVVMHRMLTVDGLSVDDVARRFSVLPRTVQIAVAKVDPSRKGDVGAKYRAVREPIVRAGLARNARWKQIASEVSAAEGAPVRAAQSRSTPVRRWSG